jgi:hypothetical protein
VASLWSSWSPGVSAARAGADRAPGRFMIDSPGQLRFGG